MKALAAVTVVATLAVAGPAYAAMDDGSPDYSYIAGYGYTLPMEPLTVEIEGEQVPLTLDLFDLVRLKECETGSTSWHDRASNPRYYGAHQWVLSTWLAYGGMYAPTPMAATITQQLQAVRNNVAAHGETFSQFPGCRRRLGLR